MEETDFSFVGGCQLQIELRRIFLRFLSHFSVFGHFLSYWSLLVYSYLFLWNIFVCLLGLCFLFICLLSKRRKKNVQFGGYGNEEDLGRGTNMIKYVV